MICLVHIRGSFKTFCNERLSIGEKRVCFNYFVYTLHVRFSVIHIFNSSNLPCLYSTFHLGYTLVLSRFCFVYTLQVRFSVIHPDVKFRKEWANTTILLAFKVTSVIYTGQYMKLKKAFGHLVPSPFLGLAYAPIVETGFLELVMSLLAFSPWNFVAKTGLVESANRFSLEELCRTQYSLKYFWSQIDHQNLWKKLKDYVKACKHRLISSDLEPGVVRTTYYFVRTTK